MSSPVEISIKEIISINKDDNTNPIYLQLVDEMIKAIHLGRLTHQTKLPGTRKISEILSINRNTIIKAFEELEAQNYITIRPNYGTYINFPSDNKNLKLILQKNEFDSTFKFKKSFYYEREVENSARLNFKIDAIDERLVHKEKIVFNNFKNTSKTIICNYLRMSKGFRIVEDNIAITNYRKTLIQILSQVLKGENNTMAVSEFNDPIVNAILQQNGWKLFPIKTDEHGIIPEVLIDICIKNKIQYIYVQPNNAFPDTTILSLERKLALINCAKQLNVKIIEEELFYELNFYQTSLPTILELDDYKNTIHLTTIAQHLGKNLKQSIVVGQKNLIKEIENYLHFYVEDDSDDKLGYINQLIEDGKYVKFLKKVRKQIKERRDLIGNEMILNIGNLITFILPKGGIYYWVKFNIKINLSLLRTEAIKMGLYIPKICIYQTKESTNLLIPFTIFNQTEILEIVQIFKICILAQIKNP